MPYLFAICYISSLYVISLLYMPSSFSICHTPSLYTISFLYVLYPLVYHIPSLHVILILYMLYPFYICHISSLYNISLQAVEDHVSSSLPSFCFFNNTCFCATYSSNDPFDQIVKQDTHFFPPLFFDASYGLYVLQHVLFHTFRIFSLLL